MRFGISAAAVIVQDERILLLNHTEEGSYDFWTPPGGRLESPESIFDCAAREAFEETGLQVELDRILYIQELLSPGYHLCKFFVLSKAFSGALTLANKTREESFLREARFFSRDALQGLTVHPEILKGQFWADLRSVQPITRYLGQHEMQF